MAWISEMKLISQKARDLGSFWSFQPLRGKGGGRQAAKLGAHSEGLVGHLPPHTYPPGNYLPRLAHKTAMPNTVRFPNPLLKSVNPTYPCPYFLG